MALAQSSGRPKCTLCRSPYTLEVAHEWRMNKRERKREREGERELPRQGLA